jgi:PAS domain S-box-containing protein
MSTNDPHGRDASVSGPSPSGVKGFGPDRFLIPAEQSPAVRYGGAVAGVLIAALLTHVMADALTRTVFLLFWPVVVGAAWAGGLGPAVLASLLSVILADYLLIPPVHRLDVMRTDDVLPFALFLVVAVVISYLVNAARRAQARAAEYATSNAALATRLDAQARDLAHQLEESQAMSEELEQSAEELEERSAAADEAERFSRSIVESISDPFVVFDEQWAFLFINAAAEKIFSASGHAEMTGKVVWAEYPELAGTSFEEHMRRAAQTREPIAFEAFYPGTGEWSATFCYPLPDGGIAAQWRNITDRKRAEEAARFLSLATATLSSSLDYEDTLARLASVVVPELGDWCAVHLVEDGRIRQVAVGHVNPAKIDFARDVNAKYPTPDDAATGVPKVVRTGVPELYADITEEMLVAGAKDEEHLRITRELNIRGAIIAPLTSNTGVIGALTLIAAESGRRYSESDLPLVMEIARRAALAVENARHHRDALEAKAHAERLQAEAETANVAKTQFLTSMSHELRTPLNAIAGYADLMSLGIHGAVTPEQAEDLDRIKRNQRHLLGIINDILNFARLDAGRVDFNIINISAFDVVDDLHPMIRPQVAGRDLHLVCEEIDRDIQVRADREKLRQVLLNLLSNAIKFTPPGGEIRLSCHADEHVVEFIVTDTGIGIPRDKLSSIFEPFVQVSRSLAQPVEGTGLGLAISRDMVEGMAGSLTAMSDPGKGSTFRVTLPRAL